MQGNDNNCGQCCIATLAEVSLEEAIEAVGKKGLTRTKHLISALKKFDISCDDTYSLGSDYPDSSIVRFSWLEARKSHWIIFFNKKYYDPSAGVFRKLPEYLKKSKPTSYLRFYLKE